MKSPIQISEIRIVLTLAACLPMFGCGDASNWLSTNTPSSTEATDGSSPSYMEELAEETTSSNKPAPSVNVLEMTAAELDRDLRTLAPGQSVKVSGVISLVAADDKNWLTGASIPELFLYGEKPTKPVGLACRFNSAKDLTGLVEEQPVVLTGVVESERDRFWYLTQCRLVSKENVPAHAPVPPENDVNGQSGSNTNLGKLKLPDGITLDNGIIDVEEGVVDGDGKIPQTLVDAVKNDLYFRKAIIHGPLSEAGLKQIAEMKGLKDIMLFEQSGMMSLDFGTLTNHPRLRSLDLECPIFGGGEDGLTNEHLQQIGKLRCLAAVLIGSNSGWDLSSINDSGIRGLENLKSLRWLSLPGKRKGHATSITDEGLASLSELPRLLTLNIWSESIDGSGLAGLKNCKSLHELNLRKCSVTSVGLRSLTQLPALSTLDLSDTKIDSSLSSTIKKLTELKDLNLNDTAIDDGFFKDWDVPLTRIHLKNTKITDKALKLLADNPNQKLDSLFLYGNEVSDEGVKHLARIKTLTFVTLPSEISAEAKQTLKQACPDLQVY